MMAEFRASKRSRTISLSSEYGSNDYDGRNHSSIDFQNEVRSSLDDSLETSDVSFFKYFFSRRVQFIRVSIFLREIIRKSVYVTEHTLSMRECRHL